METRRRTLPTALATTSALSAVTPAAATEQASNTALYANPAWTEGTDWGRRSGRHPVDDRSTTGGAPTVRSTVIAPHGGGIEGGTSELCLATAGYDPADLSPTPPAGPVHDFWMFEGLMRSGNSALHVTSTHCDDTVARSLCADSLNVLSLHGCRPEQAGLEPGAAAVLVGGLNPAFRQYLVEEFTAAGIRAVTASGEQEIAGISPDNICNRTLLGMGAQLEMTTALRAAMFADGKNTLADRATHLLPFFWTFVDATRRAIERVEAGQAARSQRCRV
ncbi:poly-gamma-glutamate hydrolase family protein [Streptomyces sp. NBC_01571]|uniref:poly-gamma-glutamate hydrolase family protein n=1 Tax=Streptomyces sp. NBC_01571 TaxID=2975883 RepID=UPI00225C28FF|nr:poly-gamma-glutamate hydrolase family protein [Streptomyces sp. NBC_01571]MCX4577076.1 poly-gamma-glutamate hydrolase family protein [Streptomyces sp. NBC_01571]